VMPSALDVLVISRMISIASEDSRAAV
jgi:hypothetical protein